jgi:hypothetical protein
MDLHLAERERKRIPTRAELLAELRDTARREAVQGEQGPHRPRRPDPYRDAPPPDVVAGVQALWDFR